MNQLLSSSINYNERFPENKSGRKRLFQHTAIVLSTISLLFTGALNCHAQESIRGLSDNPVLIKQGNKVSKLKAGSDTIILKLPFIDDFSSSNAYPDQSKWIDKYVFINSTFPINPPSIGVATFDALDENGHLYTYADSITNFNADQLTSRMIDLNFPTRNDIYLSFFYEPGGLGSLPDPGDSLMLDFWSPSNNEWKKIWGTSGDTMAHKFRQTLVHISQPEYLQKGFRFRFRNLISLGNSSTVPDGKNNSNTDFWHLDYIRLDTARSENDTTIKDVAFVEPMHSLLKNYQSMPWDHFLKASFNELQKKIKVTYRNNDNTVHNVIRNFEVRDLYEPSEKVIFSAGKEDIEAGKNFYLETDLPNPFITTSTDSALFEARSYLITDANDNKRNDTIRFRQVFSNYFAYDDGSPEYGYGFDNTAGDLGRLAYQFNSYVSDTLVAVRFFFASSKWAKNVNHFFKLAIWDDKNGKPDKLLYLKSSDNYSTNNIKTNEFNTFKLDTSLIVKGKYYVGWIQSDYFYMNVGYDINNNSDAFTFYLFQGNWINSKQHGSLMIRPVFRHLKSIVTGSKELIVKSLTVFPNPANDYITINFEALQKLGKVSYSIYNAKGMKVMQSTFSGNNTIDVNNLTSGFYILILEQDKTNFAPVKFLIQR